MSFETGRTSEEDKFLGVKTTIVSPDDTSTEDDIAISVVDDRPQDDRRVDNSNSSSGETGSDSADEEMATDSEIESYGNRAFKRMKKLKWQFHEERRAKVAVEAAQKRLKEAHESGDSEEIAKSQQAMTEMQLVQASAPAVSQRVIENWKQGVAAEQREAAQHQPVQAPQEQSVDPAAAEWQDSNPWFGNDKEMTSFAYGVHERLVSDEGIDPSSSAYYKSIDNRMREVFPSYFGDNNQSSTEPVVIETATRRKTNSVVAPAVRNTGSAPRKVTLTSTQVSLAKRLGLTPHQYATQLMKEMV